MPRLSVLQVAALTAGVSVLSVLGAGSAQAATSHRTVARTHQAVHTRAVRAARPSKPARSTRSALAAALPASCPQRPVLVACVDQDDQRMWVQRGSKIVFPAVTVRTGRSGLRTPDGLYRIYWRHQNHFSHKFDEPMPYSLFFFHGYALHATYDDVRRGGSHGCVNLSLDNARRVFGMMDVGDLVYIWGHKHNA